MTKTEFYVAWHRLVVSIKAQREHCRNMIAVMFGSQTELLIQLVISSWRQWLSDTRKENERIRLQMQLQQRVLGAMIGGQMGMAKAEYFVAWHRLVESIKLKQIHSELQAQLQQ